MSDIFAIICVFVIGTTAGLCLKGLADCDVEDIYEGNGFVLMRILSYSINKYIHKEKK